MQKLSVHTNNSQRYVRLNVDYKIVVNACNMETMQIQTHTGTIRRTKP